jgi:hypothetical protein
MRIIFLIVTLFFFFPDKFTSQLSGTTRYNTLNGMQIYLVFNQNTYVYATLNGDDKTLVGSLFFYSKDSQIEIDKNFGVYASIGFGSRTTDQSDFIICEYLTKNKFTCADYWSVGKTPQADAVYQGKNDVALKGNKIIALDTSYAPYNTLIQWDFSKNLTTLDIFDWKEFNKWQSNQGYVIGNWGRFDMNFYMQAPIDSSTSQLNLVDGAGVPNIPLPLPSQNSTQLTTKSEYFKFHPVFLILIIASLLF